MAQEWGIRAATNRELVQAFDKASRRKCWATYEAVIREMDRRNFWHAPAQTAA